MIEQALGFTQFLLSRIELDRRRMNAREDPVRPALPSSPRIRKRHGRSPCSWSIGWSLQSIIDRGAERDQRSPPQKRRLSD